MMPNKRRYLVLAAVVAVHALALGVLLSSSRTRSLFSAGGAPLEALILMRAARRHPLLPPPPLGETSSPIESIVEPIALAPPASIVTSAAGPTIDWNAAATRAATRGLAQRKHISFGFPPGGKSAITLGVPSPQTPAHYAGESDRMARGGSIEWTSDRCYVESDPPLPGEPDIIKRARVTHFGCLPPPGPDPGELFKSLPAYKRLHPP
ncbi:MAG: hypothetical protein ACRET2_08820 [Steroidobacteraceae bacterium]